MKSEYRRTFPASVLRLLETSRPDRGATATEYAILVSLIALAIVGGVALFGTTLDGWFSTMSARLP